VKILIIGGTGLISSSIVRRLLARGDDVTVVNRAVSTRPLPDGVTRIVADRHDLGTFESAIAGGAPWDVVIDMVCYHPDEAEAIARILPGRTRQYVMTSTIDVYQKPASRYPYTETEPHAGLGDYAFNKVACERILWAAHAGGGLPLTVIRPAATYGDRHLPVHSLGRRTSYLDRLRRGKPIVVHGDGSSFWVSCHADDVARAFEGAAGNDATIGRSYHATGEEWLTWDQHHAIVAQAIGAPPPTIIHIPTDALTRLAPLRTAVVAQNFKFNNIFDNAAARRDLGFEYTIPLATGIPGWYRSLEAAGLIENSDEDPLEDALIAAWTHHLDAGAGELSALDLDG
jgi:nucleoside-diphosphate-sugar epimerase